MSVMMTEEGERSDRTATTLVMTREHLDFFALEGAMAEETDYQEIFLGDGLIYVWDYILKIIQK